MSDSRDKPVNTAPKPEPKPDRPTSAWKPFSELPEEADRPVLLRGGKPDYTSDYSDYPEKMPTNVVVGWRDPTCDVGDPGFRYCSYDSGYYGSYQDPTEFAEIPQ